MKYLKKFSKHSDYNTYINSQDRILPNVSYCENENEVHYNPWTWAEEYLTFKALENGTFTFTPQNNNVISYSTDNGNTWIEGNSVNVSEGDKVLWKGELIPNTNGIGKFSSTGNFEAKGNIMSLLYDDNFKGQTDLTGKDYAFCQLFQNNVKLINAKDLILPATTLANNCYSYMFNGCTSLTTAPDLPATTLATYCYGYMFQNCTSLMTAPTLPAATLANYCYSNMFNGCTSLNYIKAMFTTTPSATYTNNWVNGVAATGTFVKNSSASWNVTSVNGVPSGWTVQTASE